MNRPRHLVAGSLSAWVDGAELREVRIGDTTVLDRLHLAVRDPDWATLPLRLSEPVVARSPGEFLVTVHGTSEGTCAPILFTVEFAGTADSLEARLHYRAVTDVTINRIGFCLLHPMSYAGSPLDALTPAGTMRSTFPHRIAPQSPFTDLEGLSLRAAGTIIDLTFSGDLFEMEDQRNWIDASYKTFPTPLSHPHPRTVPAGLEIEQAVSMRWRRDDAVAVDTDQPSAPPPLPATTPRIGLGASRSSLPVREPDIALLRCLDPAWLAVTLPLEGDWTGRWRRAVEEAAALGVPLDVTLVAWSPESIDAWDPPKQLTVPDVIRLQAYDAASHVTTAELAEALHRMGDRLGWSAGTRIAGGSRANFAELNRAFDRLPLDLLDEIVFAANPQVHAFDDASVLQTPDALALAVQTATDMAQGKPVVVAPLTLKPMYNAVAAVPGHQVDLPPDPRQHGELAGEWARRAIRASGGAAGVTIYETVGEWGVLDARGCSCPAYYVLAS